MQSFVAILTGTLLTLSIIATVQLTSTATEAYATLQIVPQATIEPNRGSDKIVPGRFGGETTALSLDSIGQVEEGSTVEFTGKLISESGKGVAREKIVILDHSASAKSSSNDNTYDKEVVTSGMTDADGLYKATWIAKAKITSDTITVYAQFDGNDHFLGSVSDKVVVTVVS